MKPQQLCKLVKGRLIDVQDGFVDTFNWLVDFCNNIKGEGDINNAKTLKVDISVPDSPVIRGGGDGGSGSPDQTSIDLTDDEELEIKGFSSQEAETNTLAEMMTTQEASNFGHQTIERYSNTPELQYRNLGSFVAGDDTNIVFTATNGQVKIDIYYS